MSDKRRLIVKPQQAISTGAATNSGYRTLEGLPEIAAEAHKFVNYCALLVKKK